MSIAITGCKQRTQLTLNGIKVLEDQFKSEEEQIQAEQTNVDNLRKQLGINDNDPNSLTPSATLTRNNCATTMPCALEGETRYMKLEKQLTQLQALSTEKLRNVLPTVIPDTSLSDLLTKLHEAEQQYATLTNDYAPADLHITRVQSMIDELNHQVDDRVAGIMAGLENQAESEKAALDALTASLEEAKAKDQAEATRGQPYWEAKRKLGNDVEFNKLLAAKIEATKLDLQIPKSSIVEITGPAEPGETPGQTQQDFEHHSWRHHRFDHGGRSGLFH